VVAGCGLHLTAEWLRRKAGEAHPAFAALAGGASIVLYAAILASLHLYAFLSPGVAFSLLALVSLLTMLLALYHGPMLAIIGILGAYVVPLLVSSGSGSIVGAMVYSLIISAAALLLLRTVYRVWLWYGVLFGAVAWWFISLTSSQPDDFRGIYLALHAYLMIAIPSFDWFLAKGDDGHLSCQKTTDGFVGKFFSPLQVAMFSLLAAFVFSIGYRGYTSMAFFLWSPFIVILIWGAGKRLSLRFLPWISLAGQWFAWLYCGITLGENGVQYGGLSPAMQESFLFFCGGMVVIYSGLTAIVFFRQLYSHPVISILSLAPVVWFALAYLLVTDLSVHWEWGAIGVILCIIYLFVAGWNLKEKADHISGVWLIMAAHFSFSLAAVMLLREATLTLALGVQVISLVSLMKRFRVYELRWLIKGLLALIVVRLSCNPWLLQYPADVHWSLWTYGGVTLCCAIAAWYAPTEEMRLKRWLEAVTLHLLILFLASEIRYWLYDGDIFVREYTLTEASIYSVLWAGLGMVYYYRSSISDLLAGYYTVCSRIMMVLALVNYLLVVTALNPVWSYNLISPTPVLNILLLAYGAPILLFILAYLYYDAAYKKWAAVFTAISLFVFVNLEIRHLWQPVMNESLPIRDGELYTYSIVWLVMAITAILVSAIVNNNGLYKAGMGLLVVVILKIFFIDMSDLQGLLRVTSFMGLGLSLLGLAYLHQRLMKSEHAQEEGEKPF
jgi:uncharacterized membrane protein